MSHTGLYMLKNKELFNNLKTLNPEVDYQALMAQMQHLSHPRRKLQDLQKNGQLIRLKKGSYVFSKEFIGKDYSPSIVANLLYGPSYLSLEYALSFYELIPERVEAFTSVTTQKNKKFNTPIGSFTYQHLASTIYPIGVCLKKTADERTFLIATPEKALMDIFSLQFENSNSPSKADIQSALEQDLRLDLNALKKKLNRDSLHQMKPHYQYRRWNKLVLNYLLESL